jgi:hypothetical protein
VSADHALSTKIHSTVPICNVHKNFNVMNTNKYRIKNVYGPFRSTDILCFVNSKKRGAAFGWCQKHFLILNCVTTVSH